MKQKIIFRKEGLSANFIKTLRNTIVIVVVFSFFSTKASVEVFKNYEAKEYQKVIDLIQDKSIKNKGELAYKDYVFLISSYKYLGDLDGRIKGLKKAIIKFPRKDILKRELSKALEEKSNSYANNKSYDILKKDLKLKAFKILSDLYKKNPGKENFTALIKFYNREGDYTETVGLLELYGRTNLKGRIYYTYLCEAQYNLRMYLTAIQICGKLTVSFPQVGKGHFYYGKSLEKNGEAKAARESFKKISGRFPANNDIQYEIGKALIVEGKTIEGLYYLEKYLSIDKTDEALVLKAETLFSLKKYDEALDVFIVACKQHKEPRRLLLNKMRAAVKKLDFSLDHKLKYKHEMKKCKYTYRPHKKNI